MMKKTTLDIWKPSAACFVYLEVGTVKMTATSPGEAVKAVLGKWGAPISPVRRPLLPAKLAFLWVHWREERTLVFCWVWL